MTWGVRSRILPGILLFMVPLHARIIKKKISIAHQEYALQQETASSRPPITIWIHGTRFIRRPIFHTFFKGTPCLKYAQDLAPDYYLYHVAKTLHKTAPTIFPMETFYLFGWSGKIRNKARVESAEILYKELHRVVAEYKKKYNAYPEIRIIGHSHGGNVALYLGKIKQKDEELKIKELILLACPVQESTKKYIDDELFEKTYALYSTLDMVQVLAPQVVYNVYRTKRGHLRTEMRWRFLSGRCFEHNPKLAQVKIKLNGRALFHTEF